jgi:hypothetical protein
MEFQYFPADTFPGDVNVRLMSKVMGLDDPGNRYLPVHFVSGHM